MNTMNPDKKERYLAAKRRLFDKVYGVRLNERQREAVFCAKGPLLVLAGAGSGKTTVLVNRISYLIKYGNAYHSETIPPSADLSMTEALEAAAELSLEEIEEILPEFISEPCPPWALLAFTFTNKAAKEIRERLERVFPDPEVSSSVWTGTFHSICLRILRKYGELLGYAPGFSIYDTDDSKRLISICMKELSIDEKRLAPKAVQGAISRAKDRLETPDKFEIERDPRTKEIREIYKLYQKKLREYNAMDFDDIIMQTVHLLETYEEPRSYYQRKFRYVLVDEYQDTNYAQFVLTKLLSDRERNIMVVGDDDQSIYKFRGATIENILNFDKTYPEAHVVKLEQNYRSTENILNAANAIISNNEDRHPKKLWSEKGAGERIVIKETADQIDEGRYIIETINKHRVEHGRKYSDYAILYRVNELARSLETTFTKSGIPYRILGGQRFYDRKEIRDMLAYLTVACTPRDDLRLKRIINEPKRGIGATTVEAVEQLAKENGLSMYEVMAKAESYTALARSAAKLSEFVRSIDRIKEGKTLPSELLTALFEETGYKQMLVAEGFEGEGRIQNVEEFVAAAIEYEKRQNEQGEEISLAGFLEEIALVSDVDKYDENADAVVMMTVHSAKGLEFPVVFLAGMEDGLFPSQSNMSEPAEMREERRLCYVAITRAKDELFITYAKNRMMYGRTAYGNLSCFIRDEVPEELTVRPKPRFVPPRGTAQPAQAKKYAGGASFGGTAFGEMNRKAFGGTSARPQSAGPKSFGVEKLPIGTRVRHAAFGEGTITFAKDMGGDVLYQVRFDSGTEKKLMATFAKLQKI